MPVTTTHWPDLITAARNGCDDALGEIIHLTRDYLIAVADQQLDGSLNAKFDASDIVQSSYLEAKQSINRFKGESEAEICKWLRKIVVHNLIDETRSYTHTQSRNVGREVKLDGVQDCYQNDLTASKLLSRQETDHQLWAAIAQLSSRERYVVEARYRFGYDYGRIAEHMKMKESAARKLFSRAMNHLRLLLESGDR